MTTHPVLIAGRWREAAASGRFSPDNPATRSRIDQHYPISDWSDCDEALDAAVIAARQLRQLPAEQRARFLERFADKIDAAKVELAELANRETALPKTPRLAEVELPRTTGQLRQAAAAARTGSWAQPTIDTALNIRSQLAPVGPVVVFGPNNFPLAFNGIAGGDFAAAIAAGNPVIAKGHPAHPGTCQRLAELALAAQIETGLPAATVQLIYATARENGLRLVSDIRVGASAFTGSRSAGLALKQAADEAGKPIYLELSSVNPVVILPGALAERGKEIAREFADSCLMGTGQFCTNPGLVILPAGEEAEWFIARVAELFSRAPAGTLLGAGVESGLAAAIATLCGAGAKRVTGTGMADDSRYSLPNALLRTSGEQFLQHSRRLQTEAFGNAALVVVSADSEQTRAIIECLEGNLTGTIYSHSRRDDEAEYSLLEPILRDRVGRLLNDKMPTGVAVSPAMNHGGPYPASGHAGFTAVGIPASLRRFAKLECYDNVREQRLPPLLRNQNPDDGWRLIDGSWSQRSIL
ncbi:NADP-dependent aldehyde dehydrogenase [Microbulbifer donghaiensis]|uniref:NADP-dependent aldehyde dehydrogenase n=1 Tax=Microbulbifer donghaiensis TaxID=494016 RepID=A0A1M4UCG7_9GAMM|nr:aldehyde dehydrogenase (NADP(+)) [Microbulbifer donghaiensis]SHE54492.1 NADP-dependent aldehyde dehydrogenase [Microbulbifer donghaiensis]